MFQKKKEIMFQSQICEDCSFFGMNSTNVRVLGFILQQETAGLVFISSKGLWPLLCLQRVIKTGAGGAREPMRLTFKGVGDGWGWGFVPQLRCALPWVAG